MDVKCSKSLVMYKWFGELKLVSFGLSYLRQVWIFYFWSFEELNIIGFVVRCYFFGYLDFFKGF